MPRVKLVKANKDHPKFGIEKGQMHYHWSLKTGPTSSREFRQLTPPRPSQLTTSEYLGTMGDYELDFGEMVMGEGLADDLRTMAENIRTLGDEQQERYDNMPDGLQQSPTGELLSGRADACSDFADELEAAADTLDAAIDEIEGKEWHELDQFAALDPEEDEAPSEEEIEDAREAERSAARDDAYNSLSFPAVE